MANQYQKLPTKQYNSPIQLYSDRSIKEIIEKESRILANGTIGIDFNNPMINKPSNLQNSAVLRMLEEEESRRRNGQPASLKRVAWPPPLDSELEGYTEQEPVQSQGGPLFTSKTSPGSQNNQASIQQPITSPTYQQLQPNSHISTNNTFQPIVPPKVSPQSAGQSLYQTVSLPPNFTESPVSFTSLARPWSSQNQTTLQFKPVQPFLINTESYQSSRQYEYQYQSQEQTRETQLVDLPSYQPQKRETSFKQYQSPIATESEQHLVQNQEEPLVLQNLTESQPSTTSFALLQSKKIKIQQEKAKSESFVEDSSKLLQTFPAPSELSVTPPILSEPSATIQGVVQKQVPVQKYQPPSKSVEPPPSTITLRPEAPVSQAPPPLVTSQPATATLRGGKHLRGDLKWPPENVRERMAADEQHLIDLSTGPALKPRKQCKDYSNFFAKHALNSTYPGYKIPPGTQFYDHNPVM